jgi:hypothetical protein
MKILLLLLISLTSIYAIGQAREYAGYIRIGSMHVPDAKSVLPAVVPGVSGFSPDFYGVGGELEYKMNRTVIDAELMILSHGPVNSGDRYAEPFTGSVMARAGYAVIDDRNIFIYPNAGIGVGGVAVSAYEKSEGVKSQMHTIYMLQPVFDLGVNGSIILYRFKDEMPTGILPVGLRAGYRFSFPSDDWRRINKTGMSSVSYSTRGWYLSIALGMGYIPSSQKNKHK